MSESVKPDGIDLSITLGDVFRESRCSWDYSIKEVNAEANRQHLAILEKAVADAKEQTAREIFETIEEIVDFYWYTGTFKARKKAIADFKARYLKGGK